MAEHCARMMRLIIADDQPVVRNGFHHIVCGIHGVPAAASTAAELLEALRAEPFDVLVLAVIFGDTSSVPLLVQIRSEFPTLAVLMLSMHADERYAVRCVRAGAHGYLEKGSTPEEVLAAIEAVGNGARHIQPRVAALLADDVVRRAENPHAGLSPRELEVFRLIALGRTPTQIGQLLHLSVKTISTYRTRILEKTGFRTNADIIAYAIRNALV
jgi:two-component system invasion response regulator UvrY